MQGLLSQKLYFSDLGGTWVTTYSDGMGYLLSAAFPNNNPPIQEDTAILSRADLQQQDIEYFLPVLEDQ